MVRHLRATLAAIEAENWTEAVGSFRFGPRAPKPSEINDALASMVAKREISAAGIDVLASKGRFGTLTEIFADRGATWADRAQVPLERCYGLAFEDAEVGVFASDEGLKLIRLDDVGKLR